LDKNNKIKIIFGQNIFEHHVDNSEYGEYIDLQELLRVSREKKDKKNGKKLSIIIEKYSNIKIYDKIVLQGQELEHVPPRLQGGEIEYIVKPGGQLIYLYDPQVFIKKNSNDKKRIFTRRFILEGASKLSGVLWLTDSDTIHSDIEVSLVGKKAEAIINGVYIAAKEQNISLVTKQKHLEKETHSRVVINGICADNAHITYAAKLFVAKNASGAKAIQKNKTILFGNKTIVSSLPEMEVLNNDVACTHGCAVGQLDEQKIFYLKSRGLGDAQAKALLIESFFIGLLHSLDDENIKKGLSERIKLKMGQVL